MKCTLRVKDEVNIKFEGLDPTVRKELVKKLSFMNPKARHTPAFKLGRWDGKVPFATIGGGTYFNLLDQALPIVMQAGYEVDIEDHRKKWDFDFPEVDKFILSDNVWAEGHPLQGQPIVLNDHQVRAVNTYLAETPLGNRHCIQSISTSAGKTIITAVLSKLIEPYGRSLVIVPGKDLVTQTLEDYTNIGLDTGIYFSDFKQTDQKHIISTWQSMTTLAKDNPEVFHRITDGVVAVIVDEAHTLTGKNLKDMMCDELAHIPLRWALTGTIPKEPHEFNALLVSIGPKMGEIRADELQELGILSNCEIDIMQLVDTVEYKAYDEELAYLTTDKVRVAWIAEEIRKIGLTGNTLVLVGRIPMGDELSEILDAPFINGKVASKKRKEEYKSINTVDNKIVIATFGVASTGINIPRIFNLVLIEPGKSFVRVIQSIGRGLRKAADKDHVKIKDICSSAKFSKRHLTKRKEFYADAGYPAKVRKINYRD
jgi:superfamily II DNA or RNA helicase